MSGYLTKLPAEEMRYSSKFDIWCTIKEYNHLDTINLSTNKPHSSPQAHTEPIPVDVDKEAERFNIKTKSNQEIARERIKELIKTCPSSIFYKSLSTWNRDYTEKQIQAINRGWEDKIQSPGYIRFTRR
jgi:hypothetical protein